MQSKLYGENMSVAEIFQDFNKVCNKSVGSTNTLPCGLSASYSPSCIAVAILFMVAMTELQD